MSKASATILFLALAAGCGEGELPGQYWQVDLRGAENLCTGNGTDYAESLEYRVEFAGNDVSIAVGPDVFATGTAEGCSLAYTSLVWSDYRDGHEIQWQILGQARVDVGGGDGCVADFDWQGTETFVITQSAHPDVAPGCTYTLDVTGTWTEEIVE